MRPASDPLAPRFPYFALRDCRHYVCQPCALAFSFNGGLLIDCPDCGAVSRLAPARPRDHLMVVNLSGRGDKDIFTVADHLGGM